MIKLNYKKLYHLSIISQISLFFVLMGALCNFMVMMEHGGKMPIYYEYIYETDEEHFVYTDKDDVKMWYFTDFIVLGHYIYSIGDFLLFLGALSYTVSKIFVLRIYLRQKRKKK